MCEGSELCTVLCCAVLCHVASGLLCALETASPGSLTTDAGLVEPGER